MDTLMIEWEQRFSSCTVFARKTSNIWRGATWQRRLSFIYTQAHTHTHTHTNTHTHTHRYPSAERRTEEDVRFVATRLAATQRPARRLSFPPRFSCRTERKEKENGEPGGGGGGGRGGGCGQRRSLPSGGGRIFDTDVDVAVARMRRVAGTLQSPASRRLRLAGRPGGPLCPQPPRWCPPLPPAHSTPARLDRLQRRLPPAPDGTGETLCLPANESVSAFEEAMKPRGIFLPQSALFRVADGSPMCPMELGLST